VSITENVIDILQFNIRVSRSNNKFMKIINKIRKMKLCYHAGSPSFGCIFGTIYNLTKVEENPADI
jgi:hypothetical protein